MVEKIKKEKHHKKHWHYVYRRRRMHKGINSSQMANAQIISLFGSIIAGVLLDANKETLALIAGTFVILPGVFDLDGSIGAALSAKINHRLDETTKGKQVVLDTIWFSIRLSIFAGVMVGLVGAAVSEIFFDAEFWKVFVVGWGAIILSGAVGFPIIAVMSYMFKKKGVNPDDVVGPIESSLFDILTVVTLTIMVRMLV